MFDAANTIPVLLVATLGCAHALAGDTSPPPGPLTPTMKTLDQVQPWRVLNDLPPGPSSAHLITEPGVYYMTTEVAGGVGQHGVEINLDGLPPGEYYVCIVSNGNPIRMGPGSLDGVHYTDSVGHQETIEICVGYSENLLGIISGAGDDGIDINGADHLLVRNMQITNSGDDAIQATTKGICEWEDIRIVGAGGDGVDAKGQVPPNYLIVKMKDVIISGIAGDGARLVDFQNTHCSDLTIDGAGGNGLVVHPSADPQGLGFGSSTVRLDRCGISSSGIDGVVLEPQTPGSYAFDLRVVDSLGNVGHGVRFSESVADSAFSSDLDQVNASDNGDDGIEIVHLVGGVLPDSHEGSWNTIRAGGNGGSGIRLSMQECTISKSMDSCSMTLNAVDGSRTEGGPTESIHISYTKCAFAGNGGSGVHVLPVGGAGVSDHCIVEMDHCSATRNTLHGVHFNWTQTSGPFQFDIKDSTLSHNTNDGLRAIAADGCGKDNNCNSNGGRGTVATGKIEIDGGTFNNNGAGGIQSDTSSCWIRVAQCSGNTGHGVHVIEGELTIDGGLFDSNTMDGIYAEDADAIIARCTARANGGNGATLAGVTADRKQMLSWYTAMQNTGNGVVVQWSDGAVISNCSTMGNGGQGIWCQNLVTNATIVDNNCNGNGGGMRVDGTNNVIQRNSATFGVLGGFTIGAGNLEGMPVDIANISTHSNPPANVVR